MKNNIWKILAIVFFATILIEFFVGYICVKNIQKSNLVKLKKLESKLDSTLTFHKIVENISDPSVQSSINKSSNIVRNFNELSGNILFKQGSKNLREISGVHKLITSTGSEFDLNIIINLIEKASNGALNSEEFGTLVENLPKNLADGNEFREFWKRELMDMNEKNKKENELFRKQVEQLTHEYDVFN